MQRFAYKLFPTLVHYCKEVLSPQELDLIAKHCLAAESGTHAALAGDSRSSFSLNSRLIDDLDSHYAELSGLRARMEALLSSYAADMGFDDVKLTNSWFNIQFPGSVLKHHVHTHSKIAAALYIRTDPASSPTDPP